MLKTAGDMIANLSRSKDNKDDVEDALKKHRTMRKRKILIQAPHQQETTSTTFMRRDDFDSSREAAFARSNRVLLWDSSDIASPSTGLPRIDEVGEGKD